MNNTQEEVILSSSSSTQTSLDAIRKGEAGLNERRKKLLERVPNSNDWAALKRDSIVISYITGVERKFSANVFEEF